MQYLWRMNTTIRCQLIIIYLGSQSHAKVGEKIFRYKVNNHHTIIAICIFLTISTSVSIILWMIDHFLFPISLVIPLSLFGILIAEIFSKNILFSYPLVSVANLFLVSYFIMEPTFISVRNESFVNSVIIPFWTLGIIALVGTIRIIISSTRVTEKLKYYLAIISEMVMVILAIIIETMSHIVM